MKLSFIVNSLDLLFYFYFIIWGVWLCVKARTLWGRLLFLAIAALAALTWGIGLFERIHPKFAYVHGHQTTIAVNWLFAILLGVGLFQVSRQPRKSN
jgi:hypothetical protein